MSAMTVGISLRTISLNVGMLNVAIGRQVWNSAMEVPIFNENQLFGDVLFVIYQAGHGVCPRRSHIAKLRISRKPISVPFLWVSVAVTYQTKQRQAKSSKKKTLEGPAALEKLLNFNGFDQLKPISSPNSFEHIPHMRPAWHFYVHHPFASLCLNDKPSLALDHMISKQATNIL